MLPKGNFECQYGTLILDLKFLMSDKNLMSMQMNT